MLVNTAMIQCANHMAACAFLGKEAEYDKGVLKGIKPPEYW